MCDPNLVPSSRGDDQPMPRRELARLAGISEGTLRNWETGHSPALRIRRGAGRSVTSTAADLRAFCAAHPELPAVKKATTQLDSPTAALDLDTLRTVLLAMIAALRATTAAHVELADHTSTLCRDHSAALSNALHGLDTALSRITPDQPDPS